MNNLKKSNDSSRDVFPVGWVPLWRGVSLYCLSWLCLVLPLAALAANAPGGLLCELLEHPEETVITNTAPAFGWIYNPSFRNDSQTGYRIVLASKSTIAEASAGDVWDSGWVGDPTSINVRYAGVPLAVGAEFFLACANEGQCGAAQSIFADATVHHRHGDGCICEPEPVEVRSRDARAAHEYCARPVVR